MYQSVRRDDLVIQIKETPCYLYKSALKLLETQGVVEPVNPPAKRSKGTLYSEIVILISFLTATLHTKRLPTSRSFTQYHWNAWIPCMADPP